MSLTLSLTRFKPALCFVYHVNPTFSAHNAAFAVALLERAERVFDLHGPSPLIEALHCAVLAYPKGPTNGGRYWDRTSDPYDVNVVLYR